MRLLRVLRLLCALLCLASAGANGTAPSWAAGPAVSTPASPRPSLDTLTPEQGRDLIARLSDAEVRDLLLSQLQKAGEPAMKSAAAPDTVALVVDEAQTLRYRLGEMTAAAPDVLYGGLFVIDRLTGDRDPMQVRDLLLGLAAILASAMIGERLFRRLFRSIGRRIGGKTSTTELGKLELLAIIALVDVLALAVFGLIAAVVYFFLHPDDEVVRAAFWAALLALLAVRVAAIVVRLVLAPGRSDLRLPALDDQTALRLFRSIVSVAALIIFAGFLGPTLVFFNLPTPILLLTTVILWWLVMGSLIVFLWIERRPLAKLIGIPALVGGQSSSPGALLSSHWHVFLTCLLIGMGLFATLARLLAEQPPGIRIIETLLLLAALPAVDGLLRIVVRRLVPPRAPAFADIKPGAASSAADGMAMAAAGTSGRTAMEAAPAQEADYGPVILRNLRVVLAVVAIMLFGEIWNISLELVAARSFGQRVAQSLFEIAITLILASAAWGVIKTAINRHVPPEDINPHALADGEGGGAGFSRLQTLLPLVRKFLLITLVAIVGMIIISSLGVDIGPLLAGAGVVGIAIGFGAQALVRDIVSGIFFLIDDAFRVGEYIDVGTAKGMVERISIRSLRLRHHLGQINTIPFGEIKHVTNYSRDWVIMKLELRVPLETDLEKVRKMVKRVGQEMLADPALGSNLLQPLKSQGVHRMEPSAYVLRVKFMAKPGEQFVLRREVFRRLHDVFRENGIRLGVSATVIDGPQALAGGAAAAPVGDADPAKAALA